MPTTHCSLLLSNPLCHCLCPPPLPTPAHYPAHYPLPNDYCTLFPIAALYLLPISSGHYPSPFAHGPNSLVIGHTSCLLPSALIVFGAFPSPVFGVFETLIIACLACSAFTVLHFAPVRSLYCRPIFSFPVLQGLKIGHCVSLVSLPTLNFALFSFPSHICYFFSLLLSKIVY